MWGGSEDSNSHIETPIEHTFLPAFSIERYSCLWTKKIFSSSEPPQSPEPETKQPPLPTCDLELTGIATLKDREFVYVKEKSGKIHELTRGRIVEDIELISTFTGGEISERYVEVETGKGRFQIKFDLTPTPLHKPEKPIPQLNPRPKLKSDKRNKGEVDDWIENPWLNEEDEENTELQN